LFDGITVYFRKKSPEGLYIHLNNAHPHNAGRSTDSLHAKMIGRIPYLTSIPDLVPSDFFLFGDIERKFTEYDIHDRQNVKNLVPTFSTKSDKKPSWLSSEHDQQARVGDRTRRGISPSVNGE
jgi:hypothetical protein